MAKDKAAKTATKSVVIQGVTVDISQPYAEGQTINAAEAKALNQVRAENIGNQLRKQIKELVEANGIEGATEEAKALVAARDAEYVLTLAAAGGGSGRKLDPIEKEARALAKAWLTDQLAAAGMTQKQYIEKNGEDAVKNKIAEVAEHPQIIEMAKENVERRSKLADLSA